MSNGGDRGHSEKKPGTGDLRADTAAGGGDEGEDHEQKTGHDTPPDEISVNRIDKLEAENESLKDRLLRALAETENLRKRAERDVAENSYRAAVPGRAPCVLAAGHDQCGRRRHGHFSLAEFART